MEHSVIQFKCPVSSISLFFQNNHANTTSPEALCIQGPENRTSRRPVSAPVSCAQLPRKSDDWSGRQALETGSRSLPPIWLETATADTQQTDCPRVAQKSKANEDVSHVWLEWNCWAATERISCTPHPLVGYCSLGRHRHGVDCRRHRLPFPSALRANLSDQGTKQSASRFGPCHHPLWFLQH